VYGGNEPLPESPYKGHRRREYCDNKGHCKQQMYLFHKKMKEDVERFADPYWHGAYLLLVERYKWMELRLQERVADAEKMQKRMEDMEKFIEDLRVDYLARLKALGMSEQEIQEFEVYWKAHTSAFYSS
jgi:hypothetical protein